MIYGIHFVFCDANMGVVQELQDVQYVVRSLIQRCNKYEFVLFFWFLSKSQSDESSSEHSEHTECSAYAGMGQILFV